MKTMVYTTNAQTARPSSEVRSLLPKAVKHRTRSSVDICPQCGGHKAKAARRCMDCFWKEVRTKRTCRRAHVQGPMFPAAATPYGGRWRNNGGGTNPKSGPVMVKQPDGSWAEKK